MLRATETEWCERVIAVRPETVLRLLGRCCRSGGRRGNGIVDMGCFLASPATINKELPQPPMGSEIGAGRSIRSLLSVFGLIERRRL